MVRYDSEDRLILIAELCWQLGAVLWMVLDLCFSRPEKPLTVFSFLIYKAEAAQCSPFARICQACFIGAATTSVAGIILKRIYPEHKMFKASFLSYFTLGCWS